MIRVISILFGAIAVGTGLTAPIIDTDTECYHVYAVDPNYVPEGALEELIAAKRENEVVYRQKEKNTNLFVDCKDDKGRVYSIELTQDEYDQYARDIHKPTPSKKEINRSMLEAFAEVADVVQ